MEKEKHGMSNCIVVHSPWNHIFELCQIGPSSTAGFVCTTYYQPCTQAKIIQPTLLVSNVSWEPVCKHNTNIKATLPQTSRAIKAPIFSVSNTCTQAVVLYFHKIDFMKMISVMGSGGGGPVRPPIHGV